MFNNISIESISSNPWLILISFIVTIISMILAILFYLKSRKTRKVEARIRSINLFKNNSEKIDKLSVFYDEKVVSNLTLTKIAFWNDGNDTINGSDIASTDPIKIVVQGEFIILESKIIYVKNESNLIRFADPINNSEVTLEFEYLDALEGVVIQILHTGNRSSDIRILGTIKGIGNINKQHSVKGTPKWIKKFLFSKLKLSKKIMGYLIILIGLSFPFTVYNQIKMKPSGSNEEYILIMILSIILGFLYVFFGFSQLRKKVPKGFEIFEEMI